MCFYIKNPNVAKYPFKGSIFIENVINHPDVILLDILSRRQLCLKWPAVMSNSLYYILPAPAAVFNSSNIELRSSLSNVVPAYHRLDPSCFP